MLTVHAVWCSFIPMVRFLIFKALLGLVANKNRRLELSLQDAVVCRCTWMNLNKS